MEALYHHLPIVTQVGDMARSRWGERLLEVLGVREGIARNEAEYVEWAMIAFYSIIVIIKKLLQ